MTIYKELSIISVMSDVIIEVDSKADTDQGSGDHDRFAHYVDKVEMTRALIEGTPVKALCGKIWVPSRDPNKFPICPTCKELFKSLFRDNSSN